MNTAVAGLAETLPFRDETFDKVISSWSLFHIVDDTYRAKAIEEMLRVCKQDGIVQVHPILLDLDEGDEFFPIPGLYPRRFPHPILVPFAGLQHVITLDIRKAELQDHIAGRFSTEGIASTIGRKFPFDIWQFSDVLRKRVMMKQLLAME